MHVENIVQNTCPTNMLHHLKTDASVTVIIFASFVMVLRHTKTSNDILFYPEVTPFFFKPFRLLSHQNCVKSYNHISTSFHLFVELNSILFTILGNGFKTMFDLISF